MGQSAVDGVLTHQRLTGARGGAHHYRVALVERVDRLELEVVERERKNRCRIQRIRRYFSHAAVWAGS